MLKKFFFGILLSLSGLSAVTLVITASAEDSNHKLIVFKSPTCGCCSNWISHMESNGFEVEAINKSNMDNVKKQFGIDGHLQSCHTAIDVTTGYVFEGHVPAGAIKQFLSRAPNGAKGLAVPGMPAGSPGMEMGNRFDPYQIVQINRDRPASLFMNVETQSEQFAIGTHHE